MIEIVEGRGVGAGKSYFVCTRIIQHLAAGGSVWCSDSFGLEWDATKALVADRFGRVLEDGQFNTFTREDTWRLHEITPQGTDELPVLVVLDECHQELNARDWNDAKKRPFFNWLTQSRHDDNDLIFISQHAANIDKQIARLVTYIVRMRNMRNFAIPGLGKWPFKQFVMVRLDQDGRTVQERKWMWQDAGIFRCYRSKVMKGAHKRLGVVIPKRKLAKAKRKKPMLKYLLLAAFGAAIWGGVRLYDRFGPNGPGLAHMEKKPGAAVPAKTDPPLPAAAAPKAIAVSAPAVAAPAAPKKQYEIRVEEFRATDEATYLRTDAGHYERGCFSPAGQVMAIGRMSAKIQTPDGGFLVVVAQMKGQPAIAPEPEKTPEPVVTRADAFLASMSPQAKAMGGYPQTDDQAAAIAAARGGLPQTQAGPASTSSTAAIAETASVPDLPRRPAFRAGVLAVQ